MASGRSSEQWRNAVREFRLQASNLGGATKEYFASLDVSLEETAVCVVNETGEILWEAKVTSEPDAITGYLFGTGLPFGRIGWKPVPCRNGYDGLAGAGLSVVCIEVRHLKAALSAMTNMMDRNDVRDIAQGMRTGWFRAVHVKSTESRELKTLLTSRKLLLNKLLDIENQLRGSHLAAVRGPAGVARRGQVPAPSAHCASGEIRQPQPSGPSSRAA